MNLTRMRLRRVTILEVSTALLRWRWVLMAVFGLVAILMEMMERKFRLAAYDREFFIEVIFEGVIFPIIGGILMTLLKRAFIEKAIFERQLSQQEALISQISKASDWNELVKFIVEFPRAFLSLIGSSLIIVEPGSQKLEVAAMWGFYGLNPPKYPIFPEDALTPPCLQVSEKAGVHSCDCFSGVIPVEGAQRFCLPLIHSGNTVALLHFYLPVGVTLSKDQYSTMVSVAPEMALAIDNFKRKRVNRLLKEKVEVERRHIARDLHDNLAQDLVYLRHRIGQLTNEEVTLSQQELRKELLQIRDSLDEAYFSLRGTLKEIEASYSADLPAMLQDYLFSIKDRVSFKIQYQCTGEVQTVPAQIARQVLYIFGEVLANVEKHSRSSQVEVNLAWNPENLLLSVKDDGIGFDSHDIVPNGHMGMTVMRDRAHEINGKLTVKSEQKKGTEVLLWLPLESDN